MTDRNPILVIFDHKVASITTQCVNYLKNHKLILALHDIMSYSYYIKTLTKGKIMTKLDKISKALGVKETQHIIDLIADLEYDYDRMSESGQETFEKLMTALDINKAEFTKLSGFKGSALEAKNYLSQYC